MLLRGYRECGSCLQVREKILTFALFLFLRRLGQASIRNRPTVNVRVALATKRNLAVSSLKKKKKKKKTRQKSVGKVRHTEKIIKNTRDCPYRRNRNNDRSKNEEAETHARGDPDD